MNERDRVLDERITAFLADRTGDARSGGLLEEIGRACASSGQLSAMPRRSMSRVGLVAGLSAALALVFGVALLALGGPVRPGTTAGPSRPPSATPGIQTIRPDGSPGAPALGSGTWQTSTFGPPIRITVPGQAWTAVAEAPRQLSLTTFVVPTATAGSLSFAWVTSIYREPCGAGIGSSTVPWTAPTAAAFFTWLKGVSPIDPGTPTPVTIAGHEGLQVEFTAPSRSDLACAGAPDHLLTLSPNGSSVLGASAIGLPIDHDWVRVGAVVVNGVTFLVITSTDDPAKFPVVAAAADPVIAWLEFR